MNKRGRQPSESMSPQLFHILLSLVDHERHGYGILLEVEERTGGQVSLGTGTIYSAIKRLRRDGLIEETEGPGDSGADTRRKLYQLTVAGRQAVVCEARRLQGLVEHARSKAVLPEAAG